MSAHFFLLVATMMGCAVARPSTEEAVVIPVEVTLYYEALCPSCQIFIPDQLLPAYTDKRYDFASLISKLTLVPYGAVRVINATTHEYECQHGSGECEGNKLHSCAIKYIPDIATTLNYISCLDNETSDFNMVSFSETSKYPVDACQDTLPAGLYAKIIKCYNSDEGWELFDKHGKETKEFLAKTTEAFVPYVSFNNKPDETLAVKALMNFRKTLCEVTGVVDPNCSSIPEIH